MKKLIALVVVMLLPLGVFAQEKMAIVYTQEIIVIMPEYKDMQKKLNDINEGYKKELQTMDDIFKKSYSDYVTQRDSLNENIRLRREQDLQDKQERMQNLMQTAEEDMQKTQQQLFVPIQDKLRNAIKAVGEEKKYLMILEPAALLYNSNTVEDATPFVKTKLGL